MQLFTHIYQLKLIPPTGKDYIKIRREDLVLVQRKYKLSQEEVDRVPINTTKQDIAIEIGQYLFDQGLLAFEQKGIVLTASLYVAKNPMEETNDTERNTIKKGGQQ
ncbi:hypothetical protein [Prevotella sp. MGM1]|uniref:hypothetical protein n=1 Tax=Prevotella sp. MGM1 TaxID=2033405 RepID=UPI000D0BEDE9|nr:hypothetical protein [Prevotella sp. MGM1]GAY28458.1 beta-N-hexosaminidase [Prevotella sp. MGM1]